ncbi:MAG: hypothetical protein J4G16_09285 [Acidobacteria bacterium]|nr:hypothetical protein [Acidobacteriota bacterium]
MSAIELPDADHVSRYCKPTAVGQDGLPMTAAFELRPGEDHLSVNWLEYFGAQVPEAAIERVRNAFQAKGYRLGRNGRFAALTVGAVKTAVSETVDGPVRIEHLPVDADDSHSGIFGYTTDDLAVAVSIKALVSHESVFPAVVDRPPLIPHSR